MPNTSDAERPPRWWRMTPEEKARFDANDEALAKFMWRWVLFPIIAVGAAYTGVRYAGWDGFNDFLGLDGDSKPGKPIEPVPPPPKIEPEPIPMIHPERERVAAPEPKVAAPEVKPDPDDLETARLNIDNIAGRTCDLVPTDEAIYSLQLFLAERGVYASEEEARRYFAQGFYERNGVKYGIWKSDMRSTDAVLEANGKQFPLNTYFETPLDR